MPSHEPAAHAFVCTAVGAVFAGAGIGWVSFATAMVAGMITPLMTWMEHTSPSIGSVWWRAMGRGSCWRRAT